MTEIERDTVEYNDPTPFDNSKLQSIDDIIKAIRHKMYGKDVREPIAQLGEALIKLLQETGGNQTAEVIAARGNFELLGIREDAQDATIADLTGKVNNKADKNYISDYLSKVSYVPEAYLNLAALKAKYPSGRPGLFITADDGHKYIWDGQSWQDCGIYQAVGIADKSITAAKLDPNAFTFFSSDNFVFNRSAMSRGFIQFEKINFEVGGISGGDGTNIESPYFARTKLGDLGFKGIAISNFNSGKYKWKIAEYNADQKFIKYVDDWSTGQNLNIVFKPGNYYRLLVTSTDSSQIDINDLVLNLKIADLAKKMTYNLGDMTRNFDYSITVGGGLEPKFNIDTKQNITIVMPLKPLTIFDGLGSQIKTSLEETAGKSYTLATGQFLIWNLQKNTINVQSVNDPRDLLNVILADNIYGNISNGYFSQFYTRKIAKNDLGYQINIAGNDHPSFVSKSDNSLDVIMPNNAIFYFNHFGKQVKMSTSDFYGKVINLPTNSVLIWNFDDNKFVVQPDKNERSINSIMLANNMYNHITSGYFERYFEEQFGQEYSDSYRKFSLTPIETNDQDMTMAGDELWIGLQSSTDHDLSKTGQIIRFDHSMKKVGRFVHNLGHLSTLDYCAETDTLLIGNASDDPTAVPEVMLIPNIKKIKLDPDWPMIDYNSDAVIKIQFPDLSSMGIGAVFGESPNILYLLIGGGPGMNSIVKVSLGIGNSDLSSAGYGNFIENTTSYNGTAQYVRRYYGRTMQVNQGATFYDGKIYAAFARHKTRFAEIKLHEPQLSNHDGYYEINDWSITRNDEPNGVVIFDGFYFRTSIDGFIVDMPIFNEQGGIGNVGEIITMKFEGTNIQMTPTSAATDLYLTNVKPDSFIVRSVSDQHGTFNWRARIN